MGIFSSCAIFYPTSTLFTKIIRGEIPCHKILEDEKNFAFMEISPLKKGHVLVIPKVEIDYIFDLSDEQLSDLMIFSKKIGEAIKKAVPCEKVAILVYGLEVRHAHIHLVPVTGEPGELNFSNKQRVSEEELASIADKIRLALV